MHFAVQKSILLFMCSIMHFCNWYFASYILRCAVLHFAFEGDVAGGHRWVELSCVGLGWVELSWVELR